MATYRTLASGRHESELEIRRSRFLTWAARATDERAARALVDAARRAHPTARHHCSAFIVSAPGSHDIERSSDDGEPSGTAGAPMLEALRSSGLREAAVVVIRYFGGVKLGTGGLVRAYGDAVGDALRTAPLVEITVVTTHTLRLPHAEAGRIEATLRDTGFQVVDTEYGSDVRLTIATNDTPALRATVAELSGGRIEPLAGGSRAIERPLV